jgi:hypothetical protein
MRRLVWIHADRKPIMLVLLWRGSIMFKDGCTYFRTILWAVRENHHIPLWILKNKFSNNSWESDDIFKLEKLMSTSGDGEVHRGFVFSKFWKIILNKHFLVLNISFNVNLFPCNSPRD